MTKRIERMDLTELKAMYDELTRLDREVQGLYVRMGKLGSSQKYSQQLGRAHRAVGRARYELWAETSNTRQVDLDESPPARLHLVT